MNIGGWLISTHSLTRRLTRYDETVLRKKDYFNSQPHKEADEHREQEHRGLEHFNSQPHKEADNPTGSTAAKPDTFQLTASQGG